MADESSSHIFIFESFFDAMTSKCTLKSVIKCTGITVLNFQQVIYHCYEND